MYDRVINFLTSTQFTKNLDDSQQLKKWNLVKTFHAAIIVEL